MYEGNNVMNPSNDIRMSQSQQENRDECGWMEPTTDESGWTFGNEEERKTKYEKSKLTHTKESYRKDITQTCLGTDNNEEVPIFDRSKKG